MEYQKGEIKHLETLRTKISEVCVVSGVAGEGEGVANYVFNVLPFYIKAESDNPKKFKSLLQKYLHENSFYSLDEYFERQVKF